MEEIYVCRDIHSKITAFDDYSTVCEAPRRASYELFIEGLVLLGGKLFEILHINTLFQSMGTKCHVFFLVLTSCYIFNI